MFAVIEIIRFCTAVIFSEFLPSHYQQNELNLIVGNWGCKSHLVLNNGVDNRWRCVDRRGIVEHPDCIISTELVPDRWRCDDRRYIVEHPDCIISVLIGGV